MGLDVHVLMKMSTTKLMDYICLLCSPLYNAGVTKQIPDWVPDQYIKCPVLLAMKKLEYMPCRIPLHATQTQLPRSGQTWH